ncbi:MAG TPA: preprotein translocase subunit YajC [Marmoricola sp.]|nr:preprotein translocase subunit YajC [Marmoricola sp.]
MNDLAQLLPFVLIAAVFWFLLIRPQRKRQQALLQTQRGLEVGDEVLLGSGIVGRVADLTDGEYLDLEVAPGVRVKALRGAVVRNLTEHRGEPDGEPLPDPPASELPEDPSTGHGRDH